MNALLDTNILIRSSNKTDPRHQALGDFLREQVKAGVRLFVAPQNVVEFWVVATRPPAVNGLGLTVEDAHARVEDLIAAFELLPDPPTLVSKWLVLCRDHLVLGRQAHDARLAAFMMGHQIHRLITLNHADFKRFTEIECVTPL